MNDETKLAEDDKAELESVENEELEESSEAEEAEQETEAQEDESAEDESEAEAEEDVIVTIGDEAPAPKEEPAPSWVKELRKTNREQARENKELKAKLEALESPKEKTATLGPKPTLSDFDYDGDAYEIELEKWYEQKRAVDQAKKKAEAEQAEQAEAWQKELSKYGDSKTKLKVKDFEEVEAYALEELSETQQSIIVSGSDNPALVIYALGKNQGKIKEVSSIKDPVKFAFAVAKLEKDLKVTNRKAPPPEKLLTGSGQKSGAVDSTLERLRDEAAKTGNYTKVTAYKRKKKGA